MVLPVKLSWTPVQLLTLIFLISDYSFGTNFRNACFSNVRVSLDGRYMFFMKHCRKSNSIWVAGYWSYTDSWFVYFINKLLSTNIIKCKRWTATRFLYSLYLELMLPFPYHISANLYNFPSSGPVLLPFMNFFTIQFFCVLVHTQPLAALKLHGVFGNPQVVHIFYILYQGSIWIV